VRTRLVTQRRWILGGGAVAVVVLAFGAVQLFGGGGGGPGPRRAAAQAAPAATAPPTTTTTPQPHPPATPSAARANGPLPLFVVPDALVPSSSLPAQTQFGNPTTLTVDQVLGDWLSVELPSRPNGSHAWVRASDVTIVPIPVSIEVSLGGHHLVARRDGQVVLEATVAVGAAATPTPPGSYFVTDVIATGRPGGAYGPFAYGLSGHSDVLTDFGGGDGQLALHGTNEPWVIGTDASHGCIRVNDDVDRQLSALIVAGTPVVVTA
jgi:lipoprotein-anchoring transpeptidase ErfK/SrfK